MRKLTPALAMLLLALAPAAHAATTYTIDPAHSQVAFKIRHLVTPVQGNFRDFEATIVKDDAEPSRSSVQFTIRATSVDTDNERRDNDLRSANFFEVEKYPTISFKSTSIERTGESSYRVTGELTMHGITKVITLPVEYLGEVKDPWGTVRAGFSTSTQLDRKEFGINWNKALDNGGYLLADEVAVEISFEAKKTQ